MTIQLIPGGCLRIDDWRSRPDRSFRQGSAPSYDGIPGLAREPGSHRSGYRAPPRPAGLSEAMPTRSKRTQTPRRPALACQHEPSKQACPDRARMSATDLRLVVDNLGPLENASVSLKPLTVLIGRNNTGKTYLAQALYAARRAVHDSRRSPATPLTTEERTALGDLLLPRASNEPHSRQRQMEDLRLSMGELPKDVQAKVAAWMRQALGDVGQSLGGQLCASFGVPSTSELTRWDQPKSVSVELHRVHHEGESTCLFGTSGSSLSDLEADVTVTLDPSDYDPDVHIARLGHPSDDDEVDVDALLNQKASRALRSATWHGYRKSVRLSGRAHYLPAGRSGLLNAWTDVVRLRLELERESFGLPAA